MCFTIIDRDRQGLLKRQSKVVWARHAWGRHTVSPSAPNYGGDLQCLPQEQSMWETGGISPSSKPERRRPAVSPSAVKSVEDLQCLHQQQSVWKTCSVSISSKECGRAAVSPPAVKKGGRLAVSPLAAKCVEDQQYLH